VDRRGESLKANRSHSSRQDCPASGVEQRALGRGRQVVQGNSHPTRAHDSRWPRARAVDLAVDAIADILEHNADIRAGIKVDDGRLEEARWRFLHGLWLDPLDPEALNGLGTIAWFGHDLDTAEFFVRAALRRLPDYENAKHDLALILDLKRRSPRPSKQRA
jgi:hypothetical protein